MTTETPASSRTGHSDPAVARRRHGAHARDSAPWWRHRFAPMVCLMVVAVGFLIAGTVEAWRDSPTYDEPVSVTAGVLALTHHDLAYSAEHPPLDKAIAAIPVLFVHPVIPKNPSWTTNDESKYIPKFIDANIGKGLLHRLTFASRIVPLLEVTAVGFVLFLLGRRLFGPWAGFLAGALWFVSPLVIGLGHLDGVDMPFALATVLYSLSLLTWIRRRDQGSTVWLGLGCVAVASTQATGFLLVGFAGLVVLVASWPERRWRATIPALQIGLITWVGVWASYLVLDPSQLLHPGILPLPYFQGLHGLASHDTVASRSFLLGRSWEGANWWYWPGSVLIKVTTPVLVALLVGPWFWRGHSRDTKRQAFLVLVCPAAILFAFIVFTPRDIGVRYLLPEIALWMVAASPLVRIAHSVPGRIVLVAGAVVALFMAGTSIPNSLAYTSPPFQPGYRVATNSNLDWGQGFNLLSQWAPGHHPYVEYFGPRGFGVSQLPVGSSRAIGGVDPTKIRGWVAVSATSLIDTQIDHLGWLRAYCPVGELGGSILLYHFATPPTGARGPTTPAALCPGRNSHRVTS